MEDQAKCGNCGHLMPMPKKGTRKTDKPEKKDSLYLKELHKGVCDLTGKTMSGALIAGCFYWCERKQAIMREGER